MESLKTVEGWGMNKHRQNTHPLFDETFSQTSQSTIHTQSKSTTPGVCSVSKQLAIVFQASRSVSTAFVSCSSRHSLGKRLREVLRNVSKNGCRCPIPNYTTPKFKLQRITPAIYTHNIIETCISYFCTPLPPYSISRHCKTSSPTFGAWRWCAPKGRTQFSLRMFSCFLFCHD